MTECTHILSIVLLPTWWWSVHELRKHTAMSDNDRFRKVFWPSFKGWFAELGATSAAQQNEKSCGIVWMKRDWVVWIEEKQNLKGAGDRNSTLEKPCFNTYNLFWPALCWLVCGCGDQAQAEHHQQADLGMTASALTECCEKYTDQNEEHVVDSLVSSE
jgi:hypothetical protein